jgi:RimJ/RimL family protein N-acetyltransferase
MTAKLETEDLFLQPMRNRHLSRILDIWRQPEVRRHLWGDKVIGEERVALEIVRSQESFRSSGFGQWAVRRREKRRAIGSCGLLWVPHREDIEIVYCIDSALWNRGYGTQAARAVLAFAFDKLQLPIIHGRCARDNIASLRVLEKIGMRAGRPHPHGECEGAHLSISRDEYRGASPSA